MTDKTTDAGPGPDDRSPTPPSFVRQIREAGRQSEVADCFDHWAPTTTGHRQIDFDLGRAHCLSALRFCREIDTANFLLYVVMAMREHPPGDIEKGFLYELTLKGLAGRRPSPVPTPVLKKICTDAGQLEEMRWHEDFMSGAIDGCRDRGAHRFFDYLLTLLGTRQRIGAGVYMLARSALNGGLH